MTKIYKIFLPEQWVDFQAKGLFTGAEVDIEDGYIHLSTREQVVETAAKHFSDHPKIGLARMDTARMPAAIRPALKWEASRGGEEFPHLYAPLPIGVIEAYWEVRNKESGFAFPKTY